MQHNNGKQNLQKFVLIFQSIIEFDKLKAELDVQKENNKVSFQEKEKQIKELKEELDGLKADKKYNKEEFDKLKAEKENNKEEFDKLKEELEKLKSEKEDNKEEFDKLKEENKENNKKINGLKIDKDALMATNNSNKELSEQKSQIKGLEDNNSLHAQNKLKIAEEINVKIIQEKKDLTDKVQKLSDKLDSSIKNDISDLENINNEISQLNNKISSKSEELKEISEVIKEFKNDNIQNQFSQKDVANKIKD